MSENEETQRFSFVKKDLVTIEPVAFLSMFSTVISANVSDYITMDKVCRVRLKIDDRICDIRGESYSDIEYEQIFFGYFVAYTTWAHVMACLLPCIVLLFIGGWSDRTGHRRVILLFPIIGRSLQIISSFINSIFFYEIPFEVHVIFNEFVVNIFGGRSLLDFALYAYVFVTSSVQNRIYRISSITICSTTGIMLGLTCCRVLLGTFANFPLLLIAIIINALTSVYIIYIVSDPKRTNEQILYDEQSISVLLKNFFNVAYIRETAQVICKKTPNNRDLRLCLQLLSMAFMFSSVAGELDCFRMISNHNYRWDESTINTFYIFNMTMTTVGLLTIVGIIVTWCKWHESVIGVVSSISRIISSFVYCFVYEHMFIIGPIVGMFNSSFPIAMASQCSKLLDNNEIGKVSALILLIGNLMNLVYRPLFIILYLVTKHTLPGAVYLARAAYTLPILSVFIWLLRDHRQQTIT